jgi:hypothetical protein
MGMPPNLSVLELAQTGYSLGCQMLFSEHADHSGPFHTEGG